MLEVEDHQVEVLGIDGPGRRDVHDAGGGLQVSDERVSLELGDHRSDAAQLAQVRTGFGRAVGHKLGDELCGQGTAVIDHFEDAIRLVDGLLVLPVRVDGNVSSVEGEPHYGEELLEADPQLVVLQPPSSEVNTLGFGEQQRDESEKQNRLHLR